jgi:hypothetical protein
MQQPPCNAEWSGLGRDARILSGTVGTQQSFAAIPRSATRSYGSLPLFVQLASERPSSEEPETTPFVKEQQSRAALPPLVPSRREPDTSGDARLSKVHRHAVRVACRPLLGFVHSGTAGRTIRRGRERSRLQGGDDLVAEANGPPKTALSAASALAGPSFTLSAGAPSRCDPVVWHAQRRVSRRSRRQHSLRARHAGSGGSAGEAIASVTPLLRWG